jgi:hypothetical protein
MKLEKETIIANFYEFLIDDKLLSSSSQPKLYSYKVSLHPKVDKDKFFKIRQSLIDNPQLTQLLG